MRRAERVGVAGVAAVTAAFVLVVASRPAAAHQLSGTRFDAPIPLSLLFVGAGLTVAVTAVWLALPTREVPNEWTRPLVGVGPRTARLLGTAIRLGFFAVVVAAVVDGLVGRQVPADNLASTLVWPVWFKGLAVVAAVFGSPWGLLSPWRTVYDGLIAIEGEDIALLGEPPDWLGEWPALVGYLAMLGVVENLTVIPRSPAATAGLIAGYAAVMVVGAVAFGPAWFRRADAFEVLYRLFGRFAFLRVRRREDGAVLTLRTPWQAATAPVGTAVLAGFVVATVYTVSFDGFTSAPEYQTLLFAVREATGTGPAVGVGLYLVGFLAFCVAFAGVVAVAERAGSGSDDGLDSAAAVRAFAPTLLPIAVAYEIAHNYPYVLGNLGETASIVAGYLTAAPPAVQPLAWLSLPAFWGSQVLLVVVGHVVAVVAAHHVCVARYPSRRSAALAHLPLTLLMVGYTALSLWIVSRPVVA
jgi:hypothetical protein